MIDKYHTTSASVHDTGGIEPLLEEKDNGQDMYLDAGYVGDAVSDAVKAIGMNPVVCEEVKGAVPTFWDIINILHKFREGGGVGNPLKII